MKLTKLADGRYLMEKAGCSPIVFTSTELDEITASRPQNVVNVIATGSGVEGELNTGGTVHLCFSDEVEEFVQAVHDASSFDYQTGQLRR